MHTSFKDCERCKGNGQGLTRKLKRVGIIAVTSLTIGSAIFYLSKLSTERTLKNRVDVEQIDRLAGGLSVEDRYGFEFAGRVFQFLFTGSHRTYSGTSDYFKEYEGLRRAVNERFALNIPSLDKMRTEFRTVNKRLYELGSNVESPNVILIRSDPRFLIMHFIVGQNIKRFMDFIDYYLDDGQITDSDYLDAWLIVKQKKGRCYEKSILLSSYLESIGIDTEILVFVPPKFEDSGKVKSGHTVVMITSGKFKGYIFDPAFNVIKPDLSEYLLMLREEIPEWNRDGSFHVILRRLFSREELSPGIVDILDRNEDVENSSYMKSYIDSLRTVVERERSSMKPSIDNALRLLNKYGMVVFSIK